MRKYETDRDYHLMEQGAKFENSITQTYRLFVANGLVWPNLQDRTDYSRLVDADMCRAMEAQKWFLHKDGVPVFGPATSMSCWNELRRLVGGDNHTYAALSRGYAIVPQE